MKRNYHNSDGNITTQLPILDGIECFVIITRKNIDDSLAHIEGLSNYVLEIFDVFVFKAMPKRIWTRYSFLLLRTSNDGQYCYLRYSVLNNVIEANLGTFNANDPLPKFVDLCRLTYVSWLDISDEAWHLNASNNVNSDPEDCD